MMMSAQILTAQPINLQAGRMKSLKRDGKALQSLKENVRFEQSGSMVYCDEAEYDPQTEDLTGRGNVRITNPDGAIVTGKLLEYNNISHIAKVSGSVKLTDDNMELTTPWIQYNTQTKLGWYGAGGNILDKETKLTSLSGSYNPNKKTLYFKNNVVLTTSDYTVKTDTLQYQTQFKRATFFALTQIDYQEKTVVFLSGWYNTEKQNGEFYGKVGLFDSSKTVLCDTLVFNKMEQNGTAIGHVYILDTAEQWQVWGANAYYNDKQKSMVVWNQAVAKQGKEQKPFQIKADTLHYNSDTANPIAIQAKNQVAFSQDNVCGSSNKLTSFRSDSTFYFSGKPVIWDSTSRISGDSMEMRAVKQKIRSLKSFPNAFIAIKEDSLHYSQIQGDSMFQQINANQKLEILQVFRQSKSIYYLRDADTLQSANLVEANHMRIAFKNGKVNTITFYEKPNGVLYPITQLPADKIKLPRFIWDIQNKPNSQTFIPYFKESIPDLPYPKSDNKKKSKKSKK